MLGSPHTDPATLKGPDPDRGTDSFPFRPGDEVVVVKDIMGKPDGRTGRISRVWEPTSRGRKLLVRDYCVAEHPDLDDSVRYWAMCAWVDFPDGKREPFHALSLRRT